jgi:hypothetical protein
MANGPKGRARTVEVLQSREVHTYSSLWHASNCVLRAVEKHPDGSSWQHLSSIVLSAFAFEAYMNHVGQQCFKCWEPLERLPPLAKFDLLCETLDVKFAKGMGERPLQTLSDLFRFRNTVSHGKSEVLHMKATVAVDDDFSFRLFGGLMPDWEHKIQTSAFATRVREDVETVFKVIHEKRPDAKEPLFSFGMGSGGASLLPIEAE